MKIAVLDTEDNLLKRLTLLCEKKEITFVRALLDVDRKLLPVEQDNNLEDVDAYIINLEGEFENAKRSECKGADLIFWLRLKHDIGKPIIITAFQSLLQILKSKPTYTVLNAKGVYFVDILSDFSVLRQIERAEKANLTKDQIRIHYLKHAQNVLEFKNIRHENANWFSLKILYDLYNTANVDNKIEYSDALNLEIYKINYLLADYTYSANKKLSNDYFKKEVCNNKEEESQLQNEITKIEKILSNEKLKFESIKTKFLKKFNISIDNINSLTEQKIYSADPIGHSDLIKWKKEYITLPKNIERLTNVLEKNKNTLEKFTLHNQNVLLVDDQSINGYFEIYKKILEGTILYNVNFNKDTPLNVLLRAIKDSINENNIKAILLDLNLYPKIDKDKKVTEKTGYQILTHLKKDFSWLPIIITTASNKVWTLEKIAESKADAYWIKEGMDNEWTEQESVDNYYKIKTLVDSCASSEYDSLNTLVSLKNYIADTNNRWWENGFWRNGKIRNSDSEIITDFLDKTIQQLQRHCKDFVMNFNYIENFEESKLSLASLCNNLGSVLEAVLGYTYDEYRDIRNEYIRQTRYYPGEEILNIRNQGSHLSSISSINKKSLSEIINLIDEFIRLRLNYNSPELEFGKSFIATIIEINEDDFKISINLKLPEAKNKKGYIEYHNNYSNIEFKPNLQLAVTPTYENDYYEIVESQISFLKKNIGLELFYFKIFSGEKMPGTNKYLCYDLNNNKLDNHYTRNNQNTLFNRFYVGYVDNNRIKKL
ncbi:MAG: response regulator [Flavobacteriaceae bacterium]|nr:response regulator [Flavobacteriaceae bacterium]